MLRKIKLLLKDERIRELIRYVIIGGCTTLVNYAMLWLLFYNAGVEYNLANAIAIVTSVVFAYITNKMIVFRTHVRGAAALAKEAATFFAARGVTMLLEWGTLFVIHTPLGVDEVKWGMVTKIAVNVVVLVLNFVLSKKVVFRKNS